jgi:hypothetical protein
MSVHRGSCRPRRWEDKGGAPIGHRSRRDRRPPPSPAPTALYYFNIRTDLGVLDTDSEGPRYPTSRRLFTRRSPWPVKVFAREIEPARTGERGSSRSWIEAISTCSRLSSRRYPFASFRFSQERTDQEVSVPSNEEPPDGAGPQHYQHGGLADLGTRCPKLVGGFEACWCW